MVEEKSAELPTPAGLSEQWPVPWQPVRGREDGLVARLSAALAIGALGAVARLPQTLLTLLIGGMARIARRIDPRRTASARAFLRQALGDLPRKELDERVLESYRHFLRVSVETLRLARKVPVEDIHERFDVRWTDEARRVRDSGQGTVLVTGHIGNWEAMPAIVPWMGFHPGYAVAKPPNNAPLSRWIQRNREHWGVRLLPRRGAMADAPRIIRSGGSVALLLDQRARKKPVLAPFFGRPARCDRSAGVLLKRLKAPVLIGAAFFTDEPFRYTVEFGDVLWPEEFARATPEEIATSVNQALEKLILTRPEQYFWLHDRYRDTPEHFPADE